MSDTKESEEASRSIPAPVNIEEAGHVIGENGSPNQASAGAYLRDDHQMIIDSLAGLDSYLDREMHLEVQTDTAEETYVSDDKYGREEILSVDENVKPKVVLEDIPRENVQDTLHSVPVEVDDQILNTTECEAASDAKVEAKRPPQSSNGVGNDDTACRNGVSDGDAETTGMEVDVKPEVCKAAGSKTCDNELISSSHDNPMPSDANEPMPSSHNDHTTPQPAHAETGPEIKNVLEVEISKAGEEQAGEHADNGNSDSPQNMFFLDADHYYDGNESGTEEDQAVFMKELENFFRERSMEFKPPKFYGEGLNCLK